jgi:hypothetical protein
VKASTAITDMAASRSSVHPTKLLLNPLLIPQLRLMVLAPDQSKANLQVWAYRVALRVLSDFVSNRQPSRNQGLQAAAKVPRGLM